MQKLRLLWMSDSPILNTGFAKVTRELLWRLAQEPRYEIACFGWFHNPQLYDPQRMPYPIFAADSQTVTTHLVSNKVP